MSQGTCVPTGRGASGSLKQEQIITIQAVRGLQRVSGSDRSGDQEWQQGEVAFGMGLKEGQKQMG